MSPIILSLALVLTACGGQPGDLEGQYPQPIYAQEDT